MSETAAKTVVLLPLVDPPGMQTRVVNRVVNCGTFGSVIDLILATDEIAGLDENGNPQIRPVVAARVRFDAELAKLLLRLIKAEIEPDATISASAH